MTYARVEAWANGTPIKNIQFKYRLVLAERGTGLGCNWSANTVRRFKPRVSYWEGPLRSGSLGQTHSAFNDYGLQIKIRAGRTLGRAYRKKIKFEFVEPDCTGWGYPRA